MDDTRRGYNVLVIRIERELSCSDLEFAEVAAFVNV